VVEPDPWVRLGLERFKVTTWVENLKLVPFRSEEIIMMMTLIHRVVHDGASPGRQGEKSSVSSITHEMMIPKILQAFFNLLFDGDV